MVDRVREEWALVECKNMMWQHDRGLWAIGLIWLLRLLGLDAFGGRGYMSPPGLVRLGLWGVSGGVLSDFSTIVLLYVKIMTLSSSFTSPIMFILTHLPVDATRTGMGYYN